MSECPKREELFELHTSVKVKVKVNFEQAKKAQSGSRSIDVLFV